MPDSLHAPVTLDALRMAVVRRNPPRVLVHHSDRGMHYVYRECRELLEELGVRQSMSRAGEQHDNAAVKSLWAPLQK